MRSGCTGAIAGSHISQAVFLHNENFFFFFFNKPDANHTVRISICWIEAPWIIFVTANYRSFRRIQLQSKVNLVLNNSNNTAKL